MGISEVIKLIQGAFQAPQPPVTPLPPPLVVTGGSLRSGFSSKEVAARIISKQSDAGAPTGDLPSGAENVSEKMEVIRIEEIKKALLNECVVDVVIPPGVPVMAIGIGNLGGPIISQGATTSFAIGKGIIR